MTPEQTARSVETVDILVGEGNSGSVNDIEAALRPLHNRVTVMSDPTELKDYLIDAARGEVEHRIPDLVILDRELLGDQCWPFIEDLQQEPLFNGTMLAIMTDERDKVIVDRAMRAGVDWFIPKPLTIEHLADLISDMNHLHMAVVRVRVA